MNSLFANTPLFFILLYYLTRLGSAIKLGNFDKKSPSHDHQGVPLHQQQTRRLLMALGSDFRLTLW
jgi:hypothetical protein